jgi:hypothetical protein
MIRERLALLSTQKPGGNVLSSLRVRLVLLSAIPGPIAPLLSGITRSPSALPHAGLKEFSEDAIL